MNRISDVAERPTPTERRAARGPKAPGREARRSRSEPAQDRRSEHIQEHREQEQNPNLRARTARLLHVFNPDVRVLFRILTHHGGLHMP